MLLKLDLLRPNVEVHNVLTMLVSGELLLRICSACEWLQQLFGNCSGEHTGVLSGTANIATGTAGMVCLWLSARLGVSEVAAAVNALALRRVGLIAVW